MNKFSHFGIDCVVFAVEVGEGLEVRFVGAGVSWKEGIEGEIAFEVGYVDGDGEKGRKGKKSKEK